MVTYQVLLKGFCQNGDGTVEDLLLFPGDDEVVLGGRLGIGLDGRLHLFRIVEGVLVGERLGHPYQIIIEGEA